MPASATPTPTLRPRPTDFRKVNAAAFPETPRPTLPLWFYIVSGLSQNGQLPLALTVSVNSYHPGAAVSLSPMPASSSTLSTGVGTFVGARSCRARSCRARGEILASPRSLWHDAALMSRADGQGF